MEKNDIFARNSGGELVIRTVNTTGDTSTNKNDVYTRDEQGRLAIRVVGQGSGGGGGATSASQVSMTPLSVVNATNVQAGMEIVNNELAKIQDQVSVLTTSVELSTEIGGTTSVLLDELTAMDIDGRPSYQEPGATVYAENGVVGIIDTVDATSQTAVVKTVQYASGGTSSADNNGLEGDYCSKYGIVDETASGLPTQGTGNQIIIPAQLVMDVPGVAGLTTNASEITHDLVSTTDCEIFLSEGTVIEATDVFFQTDEPQNGATGFAAWWNGTEWKFKSNDTGNVWRTANAVRIAKCIFTDGALTRLCFTGCRVLDKQEWLPKNGITTKDETFSYKLKIKNSTFTCKCVTSVGDSWGWGVGANFLQYGSGSVGTIDGKYTTGVRLYKVDGVLKFYIGTQWNPLEGLYTKTINGGAANAKITVPTVSGTMVVATPPTAAGNYVLKATVAEDGTVTTQWVLEA